MVDYWFGLCLSFFTYSEGGGGKRLKTNWGAAIQIAAVYVGTVVGAGFATGREIVDFYTYFFSFICRPFLGISLFLEKEHSISRGLSFNF